MTYTHSTNIRFSTSFEYFDIPLLRRCRITPCMHRACSVHAPCPMHACVRACSVLHAPFVGTYGNLWEVMGIFCVFCVARRFFHNVFYTAGRFFGVYFVPTGCFFTTFFAIGRVYIAYFALQDVFFTTFFTLLAVFSVCILCYRVFFHNVFRYRSCLHCVFSLQAVFSQRFFLHCMEFFRCAFGAMSRFCVVCFRCKAFLHYAFCDVSRFCVMFRYIF